jgi:hypothetical protein
MVGRPMVGTRLWLVEQLVRLLWLVEQLVRLGLGRLGLVRVVTNPMLLDTKSISKKSVITCWKVKIV